MTTLYQTHSGMRISTTTTREQRFGFTNNFIAEWFATDDLRVRGKFGITKYDDTQDQRLSPEHTDFDDQEATQKGLFKHSLQKYLYYEGDLSATYGKLISREASDKRRIGFQTSAIPPARPMATQPPVLPTTSLMPHPLPTTTLQAANQATAKASACLQFLSERWLCLRQPLSA